MKIPSQLLRSKWLLALAAPLALTYAVYSISQTPDPNIRPIELSADPLYAQGSGQKPTLTLALSVEFPTVGAQYRDATYDATKKYSGYFNLEKCYGYSSGSSVKHFAITGDAAGQQCAGAGFSGNFLNWASSSAIDILRLGLTGGDRVEDTAGSTILQRAVIPRDFYDSGAYFPQKNVALAVAKQALPSSLFVTGDTNNVRISNCLDRVHIYTNGVVPQYAGTAACNNPNVLMGPILQTVTNTNMPGGYAQCATDGNTCNFTGYRELIFGAGKKWSRRLVKNGVNCNTATLGDPAPGDAKRCYIANTSLPAFPIDAVAGGGDGFLYARAKVCDASDTRTTLCQKYPSGNTKPVGNMQKYSDRLRLAAFGYLMDGDRARHGGVLRAPMTYVGPKSYDANGNLETGTNPYAEWDPNTGVFKANPRSETEGISGVINYLNRFGRTAAVPGVYKSLDPLSELYYESLRYLQGLQPTPGAVSNLTAANQDGYPVYSTWADPFDGGSSEKNYSCLRNSILTIGDKNTHSDKSLPGNTRTDGNDYNRSGDVSLAANVPNFVDWTRVVGGFESGNAVAYNYVDLNGAPQTGSTSNPTTVKNAALWGMETQATGSSGAAYYMAGAAYWAHTHDIRGKDWTGATTKQRPGMRVATYVLDVNEGSASNDAATRRRTQLFLTAKYGGFNDPDGDGNPFTPANDLGQYNSRHWEKEDSPGEAKNYFLASNADAVLKALDDIFAAATKVSNTISTPATSGNQLSTNDGYYYIASFDAERWSGDLKRNTIKLDSNGNVQLGDVALALSAGKKLNALSDAQTSTRKIVVGLQTPSKVAKGGEAEAFLWTDIGLTLQGHLNKANAAATADGEGSNRLDFLRGNRANEGTLFRLRNSRLGDIINSGAAYSGVPTTRYSSDSSYKTFYTANKNRTNAVFIGANDGMLHAFNATTMDELFAYIPSWLGPKLSELTATTYNSSGHTSFVDAQAAVGEAQVGNDWKTVLVSGTGGGGQGVFALDVTDPTAFDKTKVLWEFTDANDKSMGNVIGQPRIVKLRTSAANATTPTYKWFAAVASGVNNYVNDGAGRFSDGKPALFLLDLSKPNTESWALGTNFFKIELPTSNSVALGTQELDGSGAGTGQGKPTGLINFDYTNGRADAVEFFYLGDLHGQFWKLDMAKADLSVSTESGWNLAKLSAFRNDADAAVPMYVAKDAAGKVQPITMVPTIAFGPAGSYILGFGTGKYLEAKDNNIDTNTQRQSFYVLYDSGNASSEDTTADTEQLARFNGRIRLQQGTVTSSGTISMPTFYWNKPRDAEDEDGDVKKAGWFIDFPKGGSAGGERQVTSAALFGQNIMFSSLLPPSASTSACAGGASYFYEANLASGLGQVTTVSSGAQGAPMVFSVGSSTSESDSTGQSTKTEKAVFARPGAAGDDKLILSETKTAESTVGRLSWRQINNYRELKLKKASEW